MLFPGRHNCLFYSEVLARMDLDRSEMDRSMGSVLAAVRSVEDGTVESWRAGLGE